MEERKVVNFESWVLIPVLSDLKYLLLNAVCCSLVNKSKPPGQQDWDSEDSVWTTITKLAKDISDFDPQFLLKVSLHAVVVVGSVLMESLYISLNFFSILYNEEEFDDAVVMVILW